MTFLPNHLSLKILNNYKSILGEINFNFYIVQALSHEFFYGKQPPNILKTLQMVPLAESPWQP